MKEYDRLREMFGLTMKKVSYSDRLLCNDCNKDYCCKGRVDIDITYKELEHYKTLKNKKLRKRFKIAINEKKKHGTFTCPFLEDGKCSIYDKRPLSCASFFTIKDNDNSTPEQCLDVNGTHGLITLLSFTNTLIKSSIVSELTASYSILDIYKD